MKSNTRYLTLTADQFEKLTVGLTFNQIDDGEPTMLFAANTVIKGAKVSFLRSLIDERTERTWFYTAIIERCLTSQKAFDHILSA
jgi:predicted component of type VI protein secretion system